MEDECSGYLSETRVYNVENDVAGVCQKRGSTMWRMTWRAVSVRPCLLPFLRLWFCPALTGSQIALAEVSDLPLVLALVWTAVAVLAAATAAAAAVTASCSFVPAAAAAAAAVA